jgi:hypothetical protein
MALLGMVACSRGEAPSDLGAIERLNGQEGMLARFTFPYYTAIEALPDGGAIAVWMRQEPPFRPMVYRRANPEGVFGDEQYLGSEKYRGTISVVPSVVPGPDARTLYAAWQAREPSSGEKSVVFRRSDDAGETWGEEHAINSQPTSFIPAMAADPDGAVYVAWTDERAHKRRVFFNRSTDRGATWLEQDRNLEGGDADAGGTVAVDIASDGQGRVLVVWERQGNDGRSIQAVGSSDRGTTWQPIARIDDDEPGRYSATGPRVAFVAGRAVVIWTAAATNKVARVWSDSSSDGGATWGTDVRVYEAEGGVPANVDLVAAGGVGHLVFSIGPYSGDWHIYHTRTGADGAWQATGEAVPRVTRGEGRFANPRLAADGEGRVAVAYVGGRDRVLLNTSSDQGEHWGDGRVLYELTEEQKGATVRYPQVSIGGGAAYVIWELWGDRAQVFKTLGDAESKVAPADLFARRVPLGH